MVSLNVQLEHSENGIKSIDKIEKMIYFIIEKSLQNIPIEYLLNNDIKLNKYGISIIYNPYTNKLQFNNNNDCYLKNIRYVLLKNDINNTIEYIILKLEQYNIKYYEYIHNNEKLFRDLEFIYL